MTSTPVSVRATMSDLSRGYGLPSWVRLGCLAWSLAGPDGHAPLQPGQLARALGLSPSATSNALTAARERGFIDESSTARCVVLPGFGDNPCEAVHRG